MSEVKNAGDKEQVRRAVDNEETRRRRELNDIVEVCSTPQGRRLAWRILEWTGCEGTPHRNTQELTYMAIGSGDVGRWLKAEIVEANEDLLFKMMTENKGEADGRRTGKGRNNGRDAGIKDGNNGNAEE
jgi:hypothetical protein